MRRGRQNLAGRGNSEADLRQRPVLAQLAVEGTGDRAGIAVAQQRGHLEGEIVLLIGERFLHFRGQGIGHTLK